MAKSKKKVEEAKSKVQSYDSGKYQLIVQWKAKQNGSFKFRPKIVIKDGFKKEHTAEFYWTDHTNTTIANPKGNSSEFKNSETKVTHKRKVKKASKFAADKKSKKGKIKGKWFNNYDGKVTVYLKVGTSSVSQTIDHRKGPFAPEKLSVQKVNGLDEHLRVHVSKVKATVVKPIRTLIVTRMMDIASRGYSDTIGSKNFGNDDSGGDINGIADISFDDQTTEAGHRYRYRVTSKNAKDTAHEDTDWFWTSPPAVTNVSHSRNAYSNESSNSVRFSRKDEDIDLGYFKGFIAQYSNSLPTDPDDEQVWTTIPNNAIQFYDPRNPSVKMPNGFKWTSTKYTVSGKTKPVPVRNDILFRHTGCQKDRTYRYRIYGFNYFAGGRVKNEPAIWSDDPAPSFDGTEVTYNEPYEPEKVEAKFNLQTNSVDLTITRQKIYTTADKMFIQRFENNTWIDVPFGSSDGIDISPKTKPSSPDYDNRQYTYSDTEIPLGTVDKIKYRVALACTKTPAGSSPLEVGNGKSQWKESNEVIVVTKPNPPTPVLPVNDGYALLDDGSIRLAWIHSPTDGTAQESAILEYTKSPDSFDGATSVTFTDEAFYSLDLSAFQSKDVIRWRVKTKGVHPDYSDWSEVYSFNVYNRPSISWTSPSNGDVITNLPITLGWNYSDDAGTLESLKLSIVLDEEVVANYDLDTELVEGLGQKEFSDYLFDDDETYQLILTAQSSIGISSSARLNISVKYISIYLEKGYEPDASFDEDTGLAYVSVGRVLTTDETSAGVIAIDGATSAESAEMAAEDTLPAEEQTLVESKVVRMYLYRVYNGHKTLLKTFDVADIGEFGDSFQVEDWYAPVNVDFEYQLLQITETGEVSITEATLNFGSLWWYVYWGGGEIVKARWNPTGNASFRRPEKQQIRYSGREYPVTYDSTANEETYSFSTTLYKDFDDGRDTLEEFKNMMKAGGTGVWKSFEGDVYPADFDFSYSSDYTDGITSWQCSLNVTRIDTEEEL